MRRWTSTRDRWAALTEAGPGPWTAAQLRGLGWSRGQVAAAQAVGVLRRVRQGLYAAGDRGTADDGAACILSQLDPRAALSHQSAALLHRLWIPSLDGAVHVTIPGQAERLDAGVRIHGSRLPEELVTTVHGLRVTTQARTAVDLARGRALAEAAVAIDGAAIALVGGDGVRQSIRAGRLDAALVSRAREQLWEAYRSVWSWPGTRVVRQAIEMVEIRSESPAESRSRVWLVEAGLPAPAVGAAVLGSSGTRYWGDLVWQRKHVIAEVDGLTKYGETGDEVRRTLAAERRRQADLEDAGWTVVRWTSRERRIQVVQRVSRALGRASLE